MIRLCALFAMAFGLLSGGAPLPANAQEYPAKPIRLILGFPPGASNDIVARLVAAKLTDRLGKQVVVENKPGAGATIATEAVAGAPPDGYTLLFSSVAQTVNPWIYKLKYDSLKAFAPIAMIGSTPLIVVVHPSVPARTLQELIALAGKEPGKLNLAHSGIGTLQHLAAAMFAMKSGAKFTEVPFKGGGPAMIDVVAGHSQLMLATIVQSLGHIKSGKLIPLGVAAAKRNPALPDVPTIAEAGVPDYEIGNYWSILAPAGTPQPIIDRLHKEITGIQADPDVIKQLETEGASIIRMTPAELAAFLERETERVGKVVKETGMKAE